MPGALGSALSNPQLPTPPHNTHQAPRVGYPGSSIQAPAPQPFALVPRQVDDRAEPTLPARLAPGEAKASGSVAKGLRAQALESDGFVAQLCHLGAEPHSATISSSDGMW